MSARDHVSLRQFPGVERGPSSVQFSDTGHDWLDRRSDAGALDGAFAAEDRQRRIKQLGEWSWMGDHPSVGATMKGDREQPMATEVKHLYRGMSTEEFETSKARGFIQSDERGVIERGWEGTNAGTDPATAHSYLPRKGQGRIVKLAAHPDDNWFGSPVDGYARTRSAVPWSRVVAHTEAFTHPGAEDAPPTYRDHVKAMEKD